MAVVGTVAVTVSEPSAVLPEERWRLLCRVVPVRMVLVYAAGQRRFYSGHGHIGVDEMLAGPGDAGTRTSLPE